MLETGPCRWVAKRPDGEAGGLESPPRLASIAGGAACLQLSQNLVEREASRFLAWRVIHKSAQKLPDKRLCRYQDKYAIDPPPIISDGLMIGTLKRIGPEVKNFR